MAHMSDGQGPYPDKAGEFCGNHYPNMPAARVFGESQVDAERAQREWMNRMRFGKPAKCDAGTSEEMAAGGWVGLYLKENRELHDGETPVETDALSEAVVTLAGS